MKMGFSMSLMALCAVVLMSGCGLHIGASATPVRHSSTTATKGPDRSAQRTGRPTDPFPLLIQRAMAEIMGKTRVVLYAPTVFPGSVHSPLPVRVIASASSAAPAPHYRVQFMRGNTNLGEYRISRWSSSQEAAQHLFLSPGANPSSPSYPAKGSAVNLGMGITAHIESYGTPFVQQVTAWKEGRWEMGVVSAPSDRARALAVARRIVTFAHDNFLPPPAVRGLAIVTLNGARASAVLAWHQRGMGFKTAAEGVWNSNLGAGYLSAFSMAVTMRQYPNDFLTSSRSVSPTLTTQQLSFNLRDTLLRQMSNPAEGSDCLNSSCSWTATQFSGPSVTNLNQTLRMAYSHFGKWYLLAAPMQGDPLSVLQGTVKRHPHFPYASGVAVIRGNRMDYYWLNGGREYTTVQTLSI